MDNRQTQIRERAGLEEARINADLIEFLNKWSSPVLILIGLVGLGWFGWNYLERARAEKVNQAFAALEGAAAGGSPSPASLRNIAAEYGGVGSVAHLALLRTADLYLQAAIARVEPGAELDPSGEPVNEADRLDDERVAAYLSQARDLSRQVADSTGNEPGMGLLRYQAFMRHGAALEGLGSPDEAKASYAQAAEAARAGGFPQLAGLAESRTERSLGGMVSLPSRAELAPLPGEEAANGAGEVPMNLDELLSSPLLQEGAGLPDEVAPDLGQTPGEPEAPPAEAPATP